MISFIISGVVNKELYFLWNQFKMPEYALIYLFSDLLTASYSTFFFSPWRWDFIQYFWNLNRNSVSFFIMYLKNLATNHFLSQCHPFKYFFHISSDICIKALPCMLLKGLNKIKKKIFVGRKQPLKGSLEDFGLYVE